MEGCCQRSPLSLWAQLGTVHGRAQQVVEVARAHWGAGDCSPALSWMSLSRAAPQEQLQDSEVALDTCKAAGPYCDQSAQG